MLTKLELRQRIDKVGNNQALMKKKDWSFLDMYLYVWNDGTVSYEITQHKFWFDRTKLKRDSANKMLCEGRSHIDKYDELKTIWTNFINKYNPDEYFVDQFNQEEGYSYEKNVG
tara:strand:- start:50 stop:391 length:342 start_codon:yes stop_codon:yes gene_type:complete